MFKLYVLTKQKDIIGVWKTYSLKIFKVNVMVVFLIHDSLFEFFHFQYMCLLTFYMFVLVSCVYMLFYRVQVFNLINYTKFVGIMVLVRCIIYDRDIFKNAAKSLFVFFKILHMF